MDEENANGFHLRYLDDPVLRERSTPVETFGEAEDRLAHAMAAIMAAHRGVGLAAPQVGVLRRVIVVHPGLLPAGADAVFVNPAVIWRADERLEEEEGCLSLLSVAATLARPARLAVRYADAQGRERELEAEGLGARALLHEIEHLDGVLYIDHLSRLKRRLVRERFRKLRRELDTAGRTSPPPQGEGGY